ncbi:LLM class F420-dependent oxidoreductase [Saccharothrix algeriensis]|uniref:F420-dependent oxidoreductase-like protein n=1 Tax=Saccharothrix algeriensis TaxID=173560 RepID=A0A8T8HYE0_9PSEU|nr:LLM class F420-dependent oxidoreductase [Saccharothrix algeriensis]MBM7814978.1 F420-dependent oxidoreductase-like protein [Saccharothrix algeriensis]QTR03240.1 LLM class F420-dependent oxidoreductase [Saccharothrix algeriensis]
MRLGIHITEFTVPAGPAGIAPELAEVARTADAAGVARLSVMDHFFQMERVKPATDPMLEGYTTLGFLAAHTSAVQLGLLVTGVTYRHPGLLAKIVSTVDVLSGGRAELGIGAAWYEREHLGLGVPFPPLAERFERLEEALRICLQMWDPEDDGPFEGEHYRLAETLCSPQPIRRPPILVGGGGEKKTLRLVARYADACNLFAGDKDQVRHKLDVLRGHCDALGRDFSAIEKTLTYRAAPGVGGADGFLRDVADYAGLGVDTVILVPPGDAPAAWAERVAAPLVPRLADL